jgi:hypothetical protein
MTASIAELSSDRQQLLTLSAFSFKFLATLKTEVGVLWILKLTFWALHLVLSKYNLSSLKDVEKKRWMVKLKYRKHEFVSN